MANQMFAPMNQQPQQQPMQQSQPTPSGRFAPKGSAPIQQENQSAQEDPMETLGKLKKMLDAGLIEQSEYDAKKAEVLGRM